MKKRSLYGSFVVALMAAVFIATATPVFAETGSGSGGSSSTSEQSTTDSSKDDSSESATEDSLKSVDRKKVELRLEELKKKGAEQAAKLQAASKKTEEQRTKSCEARQTELSKHISERTAAAKKHLATFDKILARVQSFKTDKNITVTDYETLVADATSKRAAAAEAVSALESLNVTVDCTNVGSTTSKLSDYREAVVAARDALKAYRTSIKNLIVAVKTSIANTVKTEKQESASDHTTSTESGAQ